MVAQYHELVDIKHCYRWIPAEGPVFRISRVELWMHTAEESYTGTKWLSSAPRFFNDGLTLIGSCSCFFFQICQWRKLHGASDHASLLCF